MDKVMDEVGASPLMNIHHLELFYYVARFGGITEAVRNIPYGIQQPAVSGQVAQLEEYLGAVLFQRRPFQLTPAGQRLYQFSQPFFSNLDSIAGELQGTRIPHIRIGAATIVLRDHLPEVVQSVRKRFAKLKISLREGCQPELESLLQKEEIDLAVTLLEQKAAPGIHSLALIELPLALLVPTHSPYQSPEDLWKRDRIEEPLICLPANEAISKTFQQGLQKLGVDWFPGLEINSVELIETYVANGFGMGLSVIIPKAKFSAEVRPLPLKGFNTVKIGALWRGKPTALLQAFLDEFQLRAKRFA
jgi:DNA-binding transcriptional LysR family regulator